MRRAGREQRIGMGALALASALAFLACGPAVASDIEWQFPLLRDAVGSGMTLEISREGTRQTATPFFTLYHPTVRRIEYRIGRMIDRLAGKEISPGTPTEDPEGPDALHSSLPPLPGEITVRSVKRFLKELRTSRKKRPVPPVAVSVPERRVGMADTAPPGAN
jgi:hypothetical protein